MLVEEELGKDAVEAAAGGFRHFAILTEGRRNLITVYNPIRQICVLPAMPPYNPTRRNRNIGTAKGGHGQDNRMTIPRVSHGENIFWERVDDARQVSRTISGRIVKFFVQTTRPDCLYACTIDDISRLLSYLPAADWEGIEAILLRQPRRKEQMLEPVWGRLAYAADLVDRQRRVLYQGPAIVLEAVNPTESIKFGRRLSPDGLVELERLKSDGHGIRKSGKDHIIAPTLESCRATQLYRTFLHELGHWVDFLQKVERPAALPANISDQYLPLLDRFHKRPDKEKEQFAHSYADHLRCDLVLRRMLPFERQLDHERLRQDNLLVQDFELP